MRKLTILCHDVSNNALGRAWVLARLSQPNFDVEIVGPALSGNVWGPLSGGGGVPIRTLEGRTRREWPKMIDGDVLVAVKPRHDSLTLALRAAQVRPRPVIADVDDWEMAFFYDYPARMTKQLLAVTSPRNFYRTFAAEKKVGRADAVTVSSTWLRGRFGGEIVRHARDGDVFDPARYDRSVARSRLAVGEEDVVVMFVGTVMKHKGVDLIVEAMSRSRHRNLVLATSGDVTPSSNGLPRLVKIPRVSLDELPAMLVAADLVVLPQRMSRSSSAQIPAKIFDALALGIPIVTSDVSDLREIIGGGGIAVSPGDIDAMTAAIDHIAGDADLRRTMATEARERFVDHYSEAAIRPAWLSTIRQAESRFSS